MYFNRDTPCFVAAASETNDVKFLLEMISTLVPWIIFLVVVLVVLVNECPGNLVLVLVVPENPDTLLEAATPSGSRQAWHMDCIIPMENN